MIYFYSGTPGSGKSFHQAQDIFKKLRRKHNVIANFPINTDVISTGLKRRFMRKLNKIFKRNIDEKKYNRAIGNFTYIDNSEMTVEFLIDYAKKNHVMGKEGQTLVCIDEAQVLFNCREYSKGDRIKWITFFSQHRKWGYNIIMVSQTDRMIDRQIRALFEYEYKHKKVNNFGVGMFIPITVFACVQYWYGIREKMGVEFVKFNKNVSDIYNSYATFED